MKNNIIGIHGVPRSGTSWLAQIFNSHPDTLLKFQPLFSYELKDFIDENSDKKLVTDFFEKLPLTKSDFINMKDPVIHKNYPKFSKHDSFTHLVFKQVRYHNLLELILKNTDHLKLILIIRNPLAVLSSWLNAPKEFNPEWSVAEEWIYGKLKNQDRKEEFYGYAKWKEATSIFLDLKMKYPDRIKIVEYQYLVSDTNNIIEEIFEFSDLNMSPQTLDFIIDSKSKNISDPNAVHRNKIDDTDWQTKLPKFIIEQVNKDLEKSKLQQYLYLQN